MRPKGKLFALFAVFAAIGLVTASGAFTTVTAERTVSVNVEGDGAALLALQPDSQYATLNSDGVLEIQFDGDNGVNPNATTEVDTVFNVTNNGDQTVETNFTNTNSSVSFYNTTDGPGSSANVTLDPGSTAEVGIKIDTNGLSNSTDFDTTVTIQANATSP